MIILNGIDIIDIRRIKKTLIRFGDRFKQKCFSNHEIKRSDSKKNLVESYAKRYAAKEACAKALGTGFSGNLNFKDIEIVNDKKGKPYYLKSKKISKIIHKNFNIKKYNCFLSISDEKDYSTAFTIIQSI